MAINDRDFQHGERIATLEERYDQLRRHITSVDASVEDVKEQLLQHGEDLRKNMLTWDRRWWIGLGFIAGLIFISGSGLVSLKQFVELLQKVAHP